MVDALQASLRIAGAGMEVQSTRLRVISENVANAEYQQYLNATNYPFQMLNVREGAISNSPYDVSTATTLRAVFIAKKPPPEPEPLPPFDPLPIFNEDEYGQPKLPENIDNKDPAQLFRLF